MFITERVRDTLIHELCHAAVWLLHGKNDGHGPYWRIWYCSSNQSLQEQMAKTLRIRLIAEQWCVTFPWNVNFCLALDLLSFILFRAKKANLTHPEIPVIARCHSYSISTKYTYQCSKCGYRLVVFEIMEVRCICMYAFFFAQCFIH